MKKYDVIIVNYNGEKIIDKCLDSIYASTVLPTKVIIYDNNSKDKSVEIIKTKYPKVRLFSGRENLGFGRANNEAMKHSEAEYILFMNNDVILDKKCAQILLESMSDPAIAVSNPLIFKGWEKNKQADVYSFGAEMNKSGFGYGLFDTATDRDDLNCFSGACFMAQGKVIKALQFEKSFFLYYEEPDLSTKILRTGHKISRKKEAICYHLESYSSPQKRADGICFRQYYAIQNRFFMLGKYWPTPILLAAIPLNIAHLLYNILFFMKNGNWRETRIIYSSFTSLIRGRREYQKTQDNSWVNKLAATRLSSVFFLRNKVYK